MSPSRTPLRRRKPTRRNRGHLTILDAMDDENLFASHFDNAESWVAWRARGAGGGLARSALHPGG